MSKPIYRHVSLYKPFSELEEVILNSDPKDPDRLYLSYRPLCIKDIDDLLNLLDKPQIHLARLNLNLSLGLIKTENLKH